MGLFKSKTEKHNRRIRKMLGKQPIQLRLDKKKQTVMVNLFSFPVSQIYDLQVDYEQIDTFTLEDVDYDYDFWKGYAYSQVTESKLGWFMGIKEDVKTSTIGVYRVNLNVNCKDSKLSKTFSAGVYLVNDPSLVTCYEELLDHSSRILAGIEDLNKQNSPCVVMEEDQESQISSDAVSLADELEKLLEGMDEQLVQINDEFTDIVSSIELEYQELEESITRINELIDRYNTLSEQKIECIQTASKKLKELLHQEADSLTFEGRKAAYVIENGNYIAGEDIAVGKYHYVIVSGSCYTSVKRGKDGGLTVNTSLTSPTALPWVFRNLRLQNGDLLTLNGNAKGLLIKV